MITLVEYMSKLNEIENLPYTDETKDYLLEDLLHPENRKSFNTVKELMEDLENGEDD